VVVFVRAFAVVFVRAFAVVFIDAAVFAAVFIIAAVFATNVVVNPVFYSILRESASACGETFAPVQRLIVRGISLLLKVRHVGRIDVHII
jgi:hypothetical protein